MQHITESNSIQAQHARRMVHIDRAAGTCDDAFVTVLRCWQDSDNTSRPICPLPAVGVAGGHAGLVAPGLTAAVAASTVATVLALRRRRDGE